MTQPYETSLVLTARRPAPRIHAVPPVKASIIRFVDAVDTAVALASRDGRLTTMNAPARDCFLGRAGIELRDAIEKALRVVLADRRRQPDASPNTARHFEIGGDRFHATFVMAGADAAVLDVGAMVMLRRESIADAPPLTEQALVQRFSLTPQEARVAMLLADQRSNREIADRLGISVHTARHHTERVLAKLDIHSRYDVRRVASPRTA